MAFGCWLNIRKNGTTYQVPCYSAVAEASPSRCPCFCVRYNGATYYASVSTSSAYAVAAFRYNSTTFYLVTHHVASEVVRWNTLIQFSSAGSYTISAAYRRMPFRMVVASSAGDTPTGILPTKTSTMTIYTSSTAYYTAVVKSLPGAHGAGGSGAYNVGYGVLPVGACTAVCSYLNGGSTTYASGGIGFSLEVNGYMAVARGGGAGGAGGEAGTIEVGGGSITQPVYSNGTIVPTKTGYAEPYFLIWSGGTGETGGAGQTAGSAGTTGSSVSKTLFGGDVSTKTYTTGGTGGTGGGGGSSGAAYATLYIGYVR